MAKRKGPNDPLLRKDLDQLGGPASVALAKYRVIRALLKELADLSGAEFTGAVSVPDEAYGPDWNGSAEVPTKNALWDKIESLVLDAVWGDITGTLSNQTDLQAALNAKQASLGYTPENVANKSTDVALGTSDTLYPSQKAVKQYADAQPVPVWLVNSVYSLGTVTAGITGARFAMMPVPADGTYKLYVAFGIYSYTGTGPTVTVETPAGRTLVAITGSTRRTLVAAATTMGTATRLDAVSRLIVDCGNYTLYAGEALTNDNGNSNLFNAKLSAGTMQAQTAAYLVKQ